MIPDSPSPNAEELSLLVLAATLNSSKLLRNLGGLVLPMITSSSFVDAPG